MLWKKVSYKLRCDSTTAFPHTMDCIRKQMLFNLSIIWRLTPPVTLYVNYRRDFLSWAGTFFFCTNKIPPISLFKGAILLLATGWRKTTAANPSGAARQRSAALPGWLKPAPNINAWSPNCQTLFIDLPFCPSRARRHDCEKKVGAPSSQVRCGNP